MYGSNTDHCLKERNQGETHTWRGSESHELRKAYCGYPCNIINSVSYTFHTTWRQVGW
jgi:hypothetical protein